MFSLFKRTKIETWEIDFLKGVFLKLSNQIGNGFYDQVSSGLLRSVMIGIGDIPNYVGFTYNSNIYNKYYIANSRNYKLSNIRVKNVYSGEMLTVSIYIAYGVVNGYSLDNKNSKYKFDSSEIDTTNVKKVLIGGEHINSKILSYLTDREKELINVDDIYITSINNKDYYHLKELEDGNFIGIDEENNLYEVKHDDSIEASQINREKLTEIVSSSSSSQNKKQ
jgi:hypothetical protein